jgi:O-antigen biosynthesis protein
VSLATLETEIRDRLGPSPELPTWPLVSIVVLNRDGEEHLRRLLAGLVEHTDYPGLELIVADNGSSDGSLDFLRTVEAPFPISILVNPHNESFSDANNQGAAQAAGELVLFLNNDIEPFEPGWLRELVSCHCESGAGAVAATLVCPDHEHSRDFPLGYGVQHRGLAFARGEGEHLVPVLRGWEEDPLDAALGEDLECDAIAAACLLIPPTTFAQIGGFTHGYHYGCEDVDLCLKLRAAGKSVVCSGRSILIHRPVSTRRTIPYEEARRTKQANLELLWRRWGPRLDRRRD